jgi:hypothetical protein
MAIANAVERGAVIHLYDEKGRFIASVPAHNGLVNFTATSVSVQAGSVIKMYNEQGRYTGSTPAR